MARSVLVLDEVDVHILERLQEDGRIPFASIAQDIGVSEGTVRQRTRRMIRRGLFQIAAVADPIQLGFGMMALLTVKIASPDRHSVADKIASFPEVSYLALCAGSVDLLAEVICRDEEHLSGLCEQFLAIPGVELRETLVYLRSVKQSERWLTPSVVGMIRGLREP